MDSPLFQIDFNVARCVFPLTMTENFPSLRFYL